MIDAREILVGSGEDSKSWSEEDPVSITTTGAVSLRLSILACPVLLPIVKYSRDGSLAVACASCAALLSILSSGSGGPVPSRLHSGYCEPWKLLLVSQPVFLPHPNLV